VWALTLDQLIQAILFFLFAFLTAIVAAVVGPTYDNILVPELSPGALYPAVPGSPGDPSNYLAEASRFSAFTLAAIVDPAIALIAIGVALLYLARAVVSRVHGRLESFLPRLVIAVVAANFTVPIAAALVGLGGALYPVLAGWDGGAWQHWVNLAGWGEGRFSWDNGALAFVLAIAQFFLVLALIFEVALRDALLAVLLVLLPIFTLLWPFGPLAPLARRAWTLFVELVFLPCVIVVPLELAVDSPSSFLLVAYLACALGAPFLLSTAGAHLTALGFPGGGVTVGGGLQRGLTSSSGGVAGYAAPAAAVGRSSGPVAPAVASAARAAGSAVAPAAAPLAAAHLVGHGALHLVRHIGQRARGGSSAAPGPWPPVRGGGSG
jgi:hypothetical protein